jgi:hypothetical protein
MISAELSTILDEWSGAAYRMRDEAAADQVLANVARIRYECERVHHTFKHHMRPTQRDAIGRTMVARERTVIRRIGASPLFKGTPFGIREGLNATYGKRMGSNLPASLPTS